MQLNSQTEVGAERSLQSVGGNDPRGVGFDVYNKSECAFAYAFIRLISVLFDNYFFHSNSVFRFCKILKAMFL